MSRQTPELTEAQRLFARSKFPFPAFVGGFGSGKTFAAVMRTVSLKSRCVGQSVAYYLPTYSLIDDIALPRFSEVLEGFRVRHRTVHGSAPYIDVPAWKGKILFRSMEKPDKIVGYEVAHSVCDELDTLPTDKAREVWNKIIARNRAKCGMRNSVAVATTPEGFRFVYERWQKAPAEGYRLYRARTADNAKNLPPDYIENLRRSYPANLLLAYLEGQFVNLTSGSVYHEFDRRLNSTSETIRPAEALHVGMDFNVGKMAAVVYVLRNDEPHAVAEHVDVFDTPAMAALLRKTYKSDGKSHPIIVYPDASGVSRKSVNASESDIALLKQAGFQVFVNPRNPAVKDRVLATNAQIHKDGVRRLRVNPDACPHLVEAFEKQAYDKNGEPDKSAGLDHVIDAATYPIAYRWPIEKRTATVTSLRM